MKFFLSILIIISLGFLKLGAQTDSVYTGTLHKSDSLKKKKPRPEDDWIHNVTYGGNFQLQLGTYTFIYLSPTIGYIPFKNFNFGVGLIYNYISLNYGYPYGKISQSVFGTHSYARYYVSNTIFVQGQYDRLLQPNVYSTFADAKTWVDYFLVGGGFRQPVGNRAALSTSLMYNLTPSFLSIYPSRFLIQFGFIGTF